MKVVLVSLAARYHHKSLAPWCLKAYAEANGFTGSIVIVEMTINDLADEIVEAIAVELPDVIGFSCYIWNINMVKTVSSAIRKVYPNIKIVLGGPEVSYETDMALFPFADAVIQGQGEASFLSFINGENKKHMIKGESIPLDLLPSPFTETYFQSLTREGTAHKLIYYESSRGCPFRCAYCLSSLTGGVTALPLERVCIELSLLISHGAKCIKFVDRTFNADASRALLLWQFILALDTKCVFHFEVSPDLFNDALLGVLSQMPAGRVQLEMGIQSINDKTLCAVNRRMDVKKSLQAIEQIASGNNVHTHVDLIAGLPYDTINTLADAINAVAAAHPHVIQLGFLKLLNGSAMKQDAAAYGMLSFNDIPYEVMCTDTLSYMEVRQLKAIEKVLDKYYNSGFFSRSVRFGIKSLFKDAFSFFSALAIFIGDTHKPKTSLREAYSLLYHFLLMHGGGDEAEHWIKLDVLSRNEGSILPDGIKLHRDKGSEMVWMHKQIRVRIEYFGFDKMVRVFAVDQKHPVTGECIIIEEKPI